MYLRLCAYSVVSLVVCILYNGVGFDSAKVFNNVRFLFFNALFVMYAALTVTILSCTLR